MPALIQQFLKENLHKNQSFALIIWLVMGLHCFLLLISLWIGQAQKTLSTPAPRLVVQTVSLSSPSVKMEEKEMKEEKTLTKVVEAPLLQPVIEEKVIPTVVQIQKTAAPPEPLIEPIKTESKKELEPQQAKPVKKKLKPATTQPKPLINKNAQEIKKNVTPKKITPQAATLKKTEPKKSTSSKTNIKSLPKLSEEPNSAKILQQKQLIAKAQESLAKMNSATTFKSSQNTATAPSLASQAIHSLKIDAILSPSESMLTPIESNYQQELSHRLQLQLRFPDYGEVKIELTVERSGKIAKIVIISAKSAANRKYIEEKLPELTFPAFGSRFDNEKSHVFTILLRNEK